MMLRHTWPILHFFRDRLLLKSSHLKEHGMPQSQPPLASSAEVFPTEISANEMIKHRGHWLAFRADGRLIATCSALKGLDDRVRAAGEDPAEVHLDRIPAGAAICSGTELS